MSSPIIESTLGATFLGFAFASVLFGILVHQTFVYFTRYHEDERFYKLVVAVIFVLELINQILTGHFCYHYTITNFSNPFAIWVSHDTWSIILQQTIGATVGSMVALCYASRVWRFSERNYWITGILICLTVTHFVCSLGAAFTIKAFGLGPIAEVYMIKRMGLTSLVFGASSDIATATALCYFLNKLRKDFQHALSTSRFADNLVRYAVSTGATTSLVSISCLMMFNLMPHNLVFIGIYFVLSKCYAISFLAMLNTRRLVNGRGIDFSGRKHSEHVRPRSIYTSTTVQVARDPETCSENPVWASTSQEPRGSTENISLEVINPNQTANSLSYRSSVSSPRLSTAPLHVPASPVSALNDRDCHSYLPL